ncbi:FAD-dependent oxidoreductase [Devosia sp. BK]|uniref:FAD-dependent oxidoreductase n=1 Tax=Devosia sp. BK TaxID=2871706 RepID=UPI00293A747F|nr:FAD-dependent oxidoreductase [Devosia sp. BK]MDV3253235.1 FAD-dependent oxidoreductase [Devosia sp. BK]
MSTPPDLCIIGAGSLGVELALYARRLGANVVLADRGAPEPGDAAHLSLRKAALAESARRVEDIRRAPDLGIGASEFKVSLKQISERATKLVDDRMRATAPEILTARGVTVMRGDVRFIDARSLVIGDITIKPRAVIIAIGGLPVFPDLEGLADVSAFTTDSILENQRKLTHLVIVGGDASALEQAQIQRRLGAEVTLVPHGELLPGFDPEAVSLLLRSLREEGVTIHDGVRVSAIKKRSQGIGVEIAGPDGATDALDASHLLISMGKEVDLDAIDIAKLKLKPSAASIGFVRGALGASSSRFVRFAGYAAGRAEWSEALAEGRAAVEAALGRSSSPSLRIPRTVLTEPALAEIAPAGFGRKGGEETILRENLAENDRAAAMGQGSGLLKVSVSENGQIARATILGTDAAELAGVLSLVADRKGGLLDLARLPMPRPSLMEVLSRLGENYLAAQDVSKRGQGGRAIRRLFER